jgi:RIO kinase 1
MSCLYQFSEKERALHSLNSTDYDDYLDDVDEYGHKARKSKAPRPRRTQDDAASLASLVDLSANYEGGFNPSFTGSRHEREWLLTYLSPFYDDHLISDVLRQVKGGKEANVYCCRAHPDTGLDLIAAKVYRPRMFRTMRTDAQYKQGRAVLDSQGKAVRDARLLKAIQQGSAFGQQASHTSWLAHEYATMTKLHQAGADVPRPIAPGENAMLMEYIGDEEMPAPHLQRVRLAHDEVEPLFRRLLRNVELMLAHDRIHGDLSAYNVLYWEGDVTIIDFPQVIDAYGNPEAFDLFSRDVERICQYFARYGLRDDPAALACEMWFRAMPDETYQVRGGRW